MVAANADYLRALAIEMALQQELLRRALYLFTFLWPAYESLCDLLDEHADTAMPGRGK